jgi:hypothetical protein
MKNSSRILSPPYTITSCDQVIELSANTLTDLTDYSKKAEKFFTLSTYLINQFDKKDSSTLTDSIGVEKITSLPQIIEGSVSCVSFYSSAKKIIMCLNSVEDANNIIKAFQQFSKCRAGGSIGGDSNDLIKILEASCMNIF